MTLNGGRVIPAQPRWKMSEPCREGDCAECVAYFTDGAVHFRCACDCHGWEADDESDCD